MVILLLLLNPAIYALYCNDRIKKLSCGSAKAPLETLEEIFLYLGKLILINKLY